MAKSMLAAMGGGGSPTLTIGEEGSIPPPEQLKDVGNSPPSAAEIGTLQGLATNMVRAGRKALRYKAYTGVRSGDKVIWLYKKTGLDVSTGFGIRPYAVYSYGLNVVFQLLISGTVTRSYNMTFAWDRKHESSNAYHDGASFPDGTVFPPHTHGLTGSATGSGSHAVQESMTVNTSAIAPLVPQDGYILVPLRVKIEPSAFEKGVTAQDRWWADKAAGLAFLKHMVPIYARQVQLGKFARAASLIVGALNTVGVINSASGVSANGWVCIVRSTTHAQSHQTGATITEEKSGLSGNYSVSGTGTFGCSPWVEEHTASVSASFNAQATHSFSAWTEGATEFVELTPELLQAKIAAIEAVIEARNIGAYYSTVWLDPLAYPAAFQLPARCDYVYTLSVNKAVTGSGQLQKASSGPYEGYTASGDYSALDSRTSQGTATMTGYNLHWDKAPTPYTCTLTLNDAYSSDESKNAVNGQTVDGWEFGATSLSKLVPIVGAPSITVYGTGHAYDRNADSAYNGGDFMGGVTEEASSRAYSVVVEAENSAVALHSLNRYDAGDTLNPNAISYLKLPAGFKRQRITQMSETAARPDTSDNQFEGGLELAGASTFSTSIATTLTTTWSGAWVEVSSNTYQEGRTYSETTTPTATGSAKAVWSMQCHPVDKGSVFFDGDTPYLVGPKAPEPEPPYDFDEGFSVSGTSTRPYIFTKPAVKATPDAPDDTATLLKKAVQEALRAGLAEIPPPETP